MLTRCLGLDQQLKSCRLKAESLMDPTCVDASWDESVSNNTTLRVQMINLPLSEALWDYVYAVVSNLVRDFLMLKVSP